MLYGKRFFFTRAVWLRTRLSLVHNLIWQRDDHDNSFSTWLFHILVCLFLFVFFTRCCSCCEGALKNKIRREVTTFFKYSWEFWCKLTRRNFRRIPEKWPWDILEQFCTGTWPSQENNTSNIETKNNDNDERRRNKTRYEVTKKINLTVFVFPPERYLFWYGRRGVGLQKGGSGRVKLN